MKKNVKVEREYEIKGDEKILICEYKYDDKGNVIYKKDKLVMNIIWNMNINVMNYLFSSF